MTDFATRSGAADAAPAMAPQTGALSLAPGLAQFYVVPWALRTVGDGAAETTVVECRYFDERWNRVEFASISGDHGFFELTQRATTRRGEKPPTELDLTLMSAVAKAPKTKAWQSRTASVGLSLSRSFIASGAPRATSLIVPALPESTRGVVLVFRAPAAGDKVAFLAATADPATERGIDDGGD